MIQHEWVVSVLRKEVLAWKARAEDRRELTPGDLAADAIDALAKRLDEVADAIERDAEVVTAEAYAAEHGVSPQTVRTWCRNGELQHARNGKRYLVPRRARREVSQ